SPSDRPQLAASREKQFFLYPYLCVSGTIFRKSTTNLFVTQIFCEKYLEVSQKVTIFAEDF
ncbi:MAG: hypothetical protein IJS97_02880, partial [Prevotella sp.]|nr:hypothetical protein [Prevotella sp.]